MSADLKRKTDADDNGAAKKSKAAADASNGGVDAKALEYLGGFGAEHSSEALPGALPPTQNTPQRCPYGLIAEQLSGSSFTTPRVKNQRSWLYRVRPAVAHQPFRAAPHLNSLLRSNFDRERADPSQLRWQPFPMPAADAAPVDWVQGLVSLCGAGSPELKNGSGIHIYACNQSMVDRAFCNSDGDLLIVPQQGALTVRTEFGVMHVAPGEICVVQRGMRFAVAVDGPSRGYVCEIFKGHFVLPDLGPIGSNGLADPRHFLHPTAAYENRMCDFTIVQKYGGELFEAAQDHSCFDVVAWHGNYVPYKYDLSLYCVVNSVLFDHLDPSIFTVLTAQSDEVGVAVCDFVIFPPRWAVQEHTFRPPYYHRNCMSEFMGNIKGTYDAKTKGFLPGGGSLHQIMAAHGPAADVLDKASNAALAPVKMPDDSLAFMFESCHMFRLTDFALNGPQRDHEYQDCWGNMPVYFDAAKK